MGSLLDQIKSTRTGLAKTSSRKVKSAKHQFRKSRHSYAKPRAITRGKIVKSPR
jgi:hypothetical protein|tara:strand:+ start:13885 stop:14046 length:162 start_codon:yes stop_codon:yes gene_type:complete